MSNNNTTAQSNTRRESAPSDDRREASRAADNVSWEQKVVARLRRRIEQLDALPEERDTGWEQGTLTVLRERLSDDT
jgi:hypothetical protein